MHTKISKDSQDYFIKNHAENNISIEFINTQDKISEYDLDGLFYESAHITQEAYYRIFIPYLFQNYKKILYIDCDLVFNTSPAELFAFDYNNDLLCATIDTWLTLSSPSEYFAHVQSLQLNPVHYFNSGVLILDIKKLVEFDLINKCKALLQNKTYLMHDQDILNILFKDKTTYLPQTFNLNGNIFRIDQSAFPQEWKDELCDAINNPKIVHYAGGKPWNDPFYPLKAARYFWEYAQNSCYFDVIVGRMLTSKRISRKILFLMLLPYADTILTLSNKLFYFHGNLCKRFGMKRISNRLLHLASKFESVCFLKNIIYKYLFTTNDKATKQ